MNGRVFDYNLGRFLSVDPFVQFPTNSQSWNPYSYLMNNPLSGTDPSGYIQDVCGPDQPASKCPVTGGPGGNGPHKSKSSRAKDRADQRQSISIFNAGVRQLANRTHFASDIAGIGSRAQRVSGAASNIQEPGNVANKLAESCSTIECNNINYGGADQLLNSAPRAIRSDWFAAAFMVTGFPGIGTADRINLGFLTDAEEAYLRSVHHSLAPYNSSFGVQNGGF